MFDLGLQKGNSDLRPARQVRTKSLIRKLSGTKCPLVGRAESNPWCDCERPPRPSTKNAPSEALAKMLRDKPGVNARSSRQVANATTFAATPAL